jgi:hypothetical protein
MIWLWSLAQRDASALIGAANGKWLYDQLFIYKTHQSNYFSHKHITEQSLYVRYDSVFLTFTSVEPFSTPKYLTDPQVKNADRRFIFLFACRDLKNKNFAVSLINQYKFLCVNFSVWRMKFHTQNLGWDFFLYPTIPTYWSAPVSGNIFSGYYVRWEGQ